MGLISRVSSRTYRFHQSPKNIKKMTSTGQHTIVLIQPTKKPDGRTYSDFKTIHEAMEGVCKLFEEHLKRQNPTKPQITYDVADLFDFIDQLPDLCCLVFEGDRYAPYNKEWIKERIYIMLRKQAGK